MRSKLIYKNKVFWVLLFILFVSVLCFLFTQFFKAYAQDEETIEEKIERVTSTNTVNVEGGIDIGVFTQRIKSGHYHNSAYINGTPFNGIITELIPEEFFYTPGTYSYMGTEWGFMLHTEQQYAAWHSWLVLIDFEISNFEDASGNPTNQFVRYRMENLINMYFSTSKNQDGTYSIMQPNSYAGFEIYITDISSYAKLLNENEPNIGDSNYDYVSDGGNIIEYGRLHWQGYEYEENNDYDWKPLGKYVLDKGINAIVSKLPVVSTIKSIYDEYTGILSAVAEGVPEESTLVEANEGLTAYYLDKYTQSLNNYTYSRELAFIQYPKDPTQIVKWS